MSIPTDTSAVKRSLVTITFVLGLATVATAASEQAAADVAIGRLNVAAQASGLQTAERVRPPSPEPPPPAPGSVLHPELTKMLELVNAERAARGLPAMRISAQLNVAAQLHSEEQARHQTMTHTGRDGSDAGQRISRTGYQWRSWGENVAYGYPTAATVMAAWMNSSGHRANLLSSNTEIGLGLAYAANGAPYWTQVFATPG